MQTTFETLINPEELAAHLDDENWAIVDCRFYLAEPDRGEEEYLQAHIPGAVFVHLDRDLSSPIIPGVTGRHPWPSEEQAIALMSRLGIDDKVQVVAYDTAGGALAASRLWWTLRWLGHNNAAVLNGGWQNWQKHSLPSQPKRQTRPPRAFTAQTRPELLVSADQVEKIRQDKSWLLVDARTPERFRGETEPIDKVAGHIPGAVNAPHPQNLSPAGVFRNKEALQRRYQRLLGEIPPERSVFYCGSGVTSIHDLLAMLYAGLGEGKLYPGSWSEWIADSERPVATGG